MHVSATAVPLKDWTNLVEHKGFEVSCHESNIIFTLYLLMESKKLKYQSPSSDKIQIQANTINVILTAADYA